MKGNIKKVLLIFFLMLNICRVSGQSPDTLSYFKKFQGHYGYKEWIGYQAQAINKFNNNMLISGVEVNYPIFSYHTTYFDKNGKIIWDLVTADSDIYNININNNKINAIMYYNTIPINSQGNNIYSTISLDKNGNYLQKQSFQFEQGRSYPYIKEKNGLFSVGGSFLDSNYIKVPFISKFSLPYNGKIKQKVIELEGKYGSFNIRNFYQNNNQFYFVNNIYDTLLGSGYREISVFKADTNCKIIKMIRLPEKKIHLEWQFEFNKRLFIVGSLIILNNTGKIVYELDTDLNITNRFEVTIADASFHSKITEKGEFLFFGEKFGNQINTGFVFGFDLDGNQLGYNEFAIKDTLKSSSLDITDIIQNNNNTYTAIAEISSFAIFGSSNAELRPIFFTMDSNFKEIKQPDFIEPPKQKMKFSNIDFGEKVKIENLFDFPINYQFYDVSGRIISSGLVAKGNKIIIQKSDYAKGIYLIQLSDGTDHHTFKILF